VSRSKQELEDRHLKLAREKVELATQLQENEEELQVRSFFSTLISTAKYPFLLLPRGVSA
jgi:hypothetical protein